jgi:anti-sigma B factor antagonist
MGFAMEVEVLGDAVVAACYGRIVYGETARHFGSSVGDLMAKHARVVLDLSGVTYCDARGLGTLATLIRRAGGNQGRLVIASTSERVGRLLRVTRLDTQIRRMELPRVTPTTREAAPSSV